MGQRTHLLLGIVRGKPHAQRDCLFGYRQCFRVAFEETERIRIGNHIVCQHKRVLALLRFDSGKPCCQQFSRQLVVAQ